MIDFDRLRRALVLGALGAVAMALLLPALAAMRYTDAHDWYAARKASVAEALIFAGFDEYAATDYRLADGRPMRWTREGVATYPRARESRSLILAVIRDNILLGACAGFAVLFALSGLLNLARHEPAGASRAPPRRPGFLEDLPPYAMDGPDRVPAGALAAAPAPDPGRAVSSSAPADRSRSNAPTPSPAPAVAAARREPPAKAEPEAAPERPARPRGRWF